MVGLILNGVGSDIEPDKDGGHVVAADAHGGVFGEEFVQKLFHDGSVVLFVSDLLTYDIYQTLAVVHIPLPNSVASHYYELVTRCPLHHLDVRLACDHLLCPRQVPVPLVTIVPE